MTTVEHFDSIRVKSIYGIILKGLTETVEISLTDDSKVFTLDQDGLDEWGDPQLKVEFFEISDEFVLQHLDAIQNQKEFNRDYVEALRTTPFGSTAYPVVYEQEIDVTICLTDDDEAEEEEEEMMACIPEEDDVEMELGKFMHVFCGVGVVCLYVNI